VTLLAMTVSGFVIWELFTEWSAGQAGFLAAPRWLAGQLGGGAAVAGFLNGLWALVVVPAVVWAGLAGVSRVAGAPESMGRLLRQMALPLAVVVAAGHMSKGLAKFVSWTPFLPGALGDTTGVATAQAITAKTMTSPAPLVGISTVVAIALALVLVALAFSIREWRLAQGGGAVRVRAAVPMVALAAGFVTIIAQWG
jgi:hypothetical protein